MARNATREDHVYLVSPETAAAAALTGVVTDPRTLAMPWSRRSPPTRRRVALEKGPNIKPLPALGALSEVLRVPVLLEVGDDELEMVSAGGLIPVMRARLGRAG